MIFILYLRYPSRGK